MTPLRRGAAAPSGEGHGVRKPRLELLYLDDCPNQEAFLPRLRRLLADHAIATPITLTRIDSDEDAQRHQFLGSPTLRVDGRDVDPTAGARTTYGLQCRLYATDQGRAGAHQTSGS